MRILALMGAMCVACAGALAEEALIELEVSQFAPEAGEGVIAELGEEAPLEAEGLLLSGDAQSPEGELYRLEAGDSASIGEGAPAPEPEEARPEASRDLFANGQTTGLGVAKRSQAKIQAFVNAHPAYAGQVNLYSVAPTESPYAIGRLSPVNQRSALNLLNQLRYIAGLDANLTLRAEGEEEMAAAALVLRLNGALTHDPARPAALADAAYDELYALGYDGAGRANIAKGYKATGSILAYIADTEAENLADVGHRRWILNPAMGATVMGANGSYSAMYAHDMSGAGGQTKVAWPAQQMPVQYFTAEDPWSLSFGVPLDPEGVSVELTRRGDGLTWRFSQTQSDGFFNVDNHRYGQQGCVIFCPAGLEHINPGDVFDVAVADGAGEVVRYTVTFFALDMSAAQPLSQTELSAEKTAKGNALHWSRVAGAKGYYVCRRSATEPNRIVADVKKTAWTDGEADPAEVYLYQVYPHTDSLTSAMAASVEPAGPKPKSIQLNLKGTVKLYTHQTLRLEAALKPALAQAALRWKSSKPKVAAVDDAGLVTPLKKGTAVITVATDNGLKASVKVKVLNPPKPTGVTLKPAQKIAVEVGESVSLTATIRPEGAVTQLIWRSADKRIAKVSKRGVVTGVKPGLTSVTVKTSNGKRDAVLVLVRGVTPTGVALNRSGTVKLRAGEKLWLLTTVTPEDAVTGLTWRSDDKAVAGVSQKGVVTARKPGVATITVKTDNGCADSVKIRVVE